VKLSQGAKAGHGGILPAAKLTPEIIEIRKRRARRGCDLAAGTHRSSPRPIGLLQFLQQLREHRAASRSDSSSASASAHEFFGIVKAMLESGILPDFITVDGGEGGTGAAPLEFRFGGHSR
jgi:glutamate synthase domain-containing protein 2